jgi:N-carbamoylputrescine amidase
LNLQTALKKVNNNTMIRVGLVQQSCSGDRNDNIGKSLRGIEQCAENGANLVVLQELHCGPYFCQAEDTAMFDWANPVPGPDTEVFAEAAVKYGVVLVTSLFEKRAPGLYHNTSVVFEKDGSIAGKYRKMHIPDDPAYYEKFYFTPGDLGFQPIQTSVGKLGVLVCWDQWYPEAARLMALAGAEMLIYPTAIGWESTDPADEKSRQHDAWFTIQRAHAIANGLPVVSVNRVGHEPDWTGVTNGIQFWGQSFVAGPQGEVLFLASPEQEETVVVEIDKSRTETVRRIWPFFRDRRIDAYGDVTERYLL